MGCTGTIVSRLMFSFLRCLGYRNENSMTGQRFSLNSPQLQKSRQKGIVRRRFQICPRHRSDRSIDLLVGFVRRQKNDRQTIVSLTRMMMVMMGGVADERSRGAVG